MREVAMARSLDPKKIKSAQRALEILEFFQSGRNQATVMDIARAMGYPQSSTSELLGCLVVLGYLHHDRAARTYRPTARVAVLGAWVQPNLFRQGRLLAVMDDLAHEAQATVVLGSRVGLEVQHIHAVGAPNEVPLVAEGSSTWLTRSALGKTLMTTMDRNYLRKLMHRLNAEVAAEARMPFEELSAECDQIQSQGFASAQDGAHRVLSVLIPGSGEGEDLALGVVVPEEAFETGRDHYVQLLRGAAARMANTAREPRASMRPREAEGAMRMTG
jgi:DNA-binding IclR family transcriptional regulator